jgi:hypothetical protein
VSTSLRCGVGVSWNSIVWTKESSWGLQPQLSFQTIEQVPSSWLRHGRDKVVIFILKVANITTRLGPRMVDARVIVEKSGPGNTPGSAEALPTRHLVPDSGPWIRDCPHRCSPYQNKTERDGTRKHPFTDPYTTLQWLRVNHAPCHRWGRWNQISPSTSRASKPTLSLPISLPISPFAPTSTSTSVSHTPVCTCYISFVCGSGLSLSHLSVP